MDSSKTGPTALGPTTIRRMTLTDQVIEKLREAILSGAYGLGSQLNEVEIARQCGVSRGPVREAIQRLVQQGLLHSTPHRGVSVPDLKDEDLCDIYFVRDRIEGAAIHAMVKAGKHQETAKLLREILAQMARAERRKDWNAVADLDMDLHSQIVAASGSDRLMRMYRTLVAEMKLCFRLLLGGYRGREGIVESHQKLIELIAAGELEAAQAELSAHLEEPLESLRAARGALSQRSA